MNALFKPSNARTRNGIVLVAVLAVLVYANSLGGGFVSDDRALILDHPYTKRVADWPAIFTAGHYAGSGGYRPITTLSFALNHFIGGLNPVGYHAVNIALHALNSVLVALLLLRLFRSEGVALAGAVLFAIHPVHTEAVAWISGRAELLAGGFFLTAWLLHLRARDEPLARRYRVVSWLSFFAAALSKENALVFPVALILGDVFLQGPRAGPPSAAWRQTALRTYLPYFGVVAAYFALRWSLYAQPLLRATSKIAFVDNPLAHASFVSRILTALEVLADYLRLLFWPAKLCADYSFDTVPLVTSPFAAGVIVAVSAGAILLIVATRSFLQRGQLWFGIAFGFLTIAPVSNLFVTFGTIQAERVLYLPSIGFCAVAGVIWIWLLRQSKERPIVRVGMVAATAALSFAAAARTMVRNRDWKNEDTLWLATAETAPRNFKAQILVGDRRMRSGRGVEAIRAFEQARRIDPQSEDAALSLAVALLQAGRYQEAIAICRDSISRNPGRAAFHVNLGLALAGTNDLAGAIEELERALRISPENPPLYLNLGLALSRSGDVEGAIARYREAIRVNPAYAEAWNALGAALIKTRRVEEARVALQQALALRPDFPEASYNLKLIETR